MELDGRKRQGLLSGLRPEELEWAQAEWSRVKPELDEWRWRLDEKLPGRWCEIGCALRSLEKCIISDVSICSKLGLELAPDAVNLTANDRQIQLDENLKNHRVKLPKLISFNFYNVVVVFSGLKSIYHYKSLIN